MRLALLPIPLLLLAACGNTVHRNAAKACLAEVDTRLAGKLFDVDVDQLTASAVSQAAETLQLSAPIVFDRGRPTEYTQIIECRVRLDAESPTVIFLQFNWSMDDVKKGQ
jgi:hypothetical protein